MDTPGSIGRLIFAGAVIVMALLAMAAGWVMTWLVERRARRSWIPQGAAAASPSAARAGTLREPTTAPRSAEAPDRTTFDSTQRAA